MGVLFVLHTETSNKKWLQLQKYVENCMLLNLPTKMAPLQKYVEISYPILYHDPYISLTCFDMIVTKLAPLQKYVEISYPTSIHKHHML